eukprot:TRINITY_DN10635_c0_g1_i2.p1 TRINITY_DN10635_c0_g1~~TRINITY_DN10635_c0_g1_i2.p1  ORF type:complete len:278 (-),score=51.65 TRINITY_DN10635_c0_g1_i2:236-1036(-)
MMSNDARGVHEASTSGSRGSAQQQRFDPLARTRSGKPATKARAPTDTPPAVNDMADQLAMLFQEMSAAPGGFDAASETGRPPGGDMAAAIKRMGEASAAAALATGDVSNRQSSDNEAVMASFIESMTKVLEGGEEDSDALMNSVMRQLLSKEVLYGPLKEVADQYPEWLAQHESSLTSEERSKYEKQLELIHQICSLLDEHGDTHFEELTALLGQLQDLGQPPQEIVDKLSPELQSSGGLPGFPSGADGGNPDCPIQQQNGRSCNL